MSAIPKRSFGAMSGGEGSTASASGLVKKAKTLQEPLKTTINQFFAPKPIAGTSTSSPSSTLSPKIIQIRSPPTLQHWIWLDPFDKSLDKGDVAGFKEGKEGVVDLTEESTGGLQETVTITNAIASSSTLASSPVVSTSKTLVQTSSGPTVPDSSSSKTKIKIAFFDLDGTLITTKSGTGFPSSDTDWRWWWGGTGFGGKGSGNGTLSENGKGKGKGSVKSGLKGCWEDGYHLVIISNQKLKDAALEKWKKKIQYICADLPPNIPLRILAATGEDEFRKPRIGMYEAVEALYRDEGLEIDRLNSFYVGDAAGRPRDHNDTDRKWAINAGLRFYTPEEYFQGKDGDQGYGALKGFDALNYDHTMQNAEVTPTRTPIVPKEKKDRREIVLFVGSPAVGKTTFFKRHFQPKGYIHVNQDTLKSRDKCLSVVREVLRGGEGGCVVDNTNRDVATRRHYVEIAQEAEIPIRCFHFTAPQALARHNNAYRAWCEPIAPGSTTPKRTFLPWTAISSFYDTVQAPTEKEGFVEIRMVNFKFDGEEEEKEVWGRWMF